MWRLQVGDKERRRVPIPSELRDSLREVFDLIQQARHDPDIVLDYDDAIQAGAVCGGRYGKKPRPYVLTYFPAGEGDRGRWYLTLHKTEIEDIGEGRMTEIAMYCCAPPDCRCKFREADRHCFHCDYVPDTSYAHLAIDEAVPRLEAMGVTGLSATSTRSDVSAALGQPQEFGGGLRDQALGYVRPWVKYQRPDGQLRFEFDQKELVTAVTFMPADWRPGA